MLIFITCKAWFKLLRVSTLTQQSVGNATETLNLHSIDGNGQNKLENGHDILLSKNQKFFLIRQLRWRRREETSSEIIIRFPENVN